MAYNLPVAQYRPYNYVMPYGPSPYDSPNYGNNYAQNNYGQYSIYDPYGSGVSHDAYVNRNNLLTDLADRGLGGSTRRIAVEEMARRAAFGNLDGYQGGGFPGYRPGGNQYYNTPAAPVSATDIRQILAQLNMAGRPPAPDQTSAATSTQQFAPPPQAPAPQQAAPPRQTTAQAIAAINAQRAQAGATSDEFKRRGLMIALQDGIRSGGLEGEAQTRQALRMLTQFGFAEQNPGAATGGTINAKVGTVPYQYFANPNAQGGQYGGGASYYQPGYGKGNAYYSRMAEIQNSREAFKRSKGYQQSLNSPAYRSAMALRDELGVDPALFGG